MTAKDIKKHQFKKGTTGNKNGRPKKLKTVLKKEGLSQSQINDIITEMLSMTKEELKAVATNPKSRSFEILVASAIGKGISKGDLSQIFGYALTRAFGQPKQDVDLGVKDGTINITVTGVSPEVKK